MIQNNIQIPSPLQPELDAFWQTMRAQTDLAALDQEFVRQCNRVVACSHFAARLILKHTEQVLTAWQQSKFADNLWADKFAEKVAACSDAKQLQQLLRIQRNLELFRIIWLDINQRLEVAAAMLAWSEFADQCILQVLTWAQQQNLKIYGEAQNPAGVSQNLLVVTLGKLGAQELNYSSDIDIMFAYAEDGSSTGPRKIDNDRYFSLIAQQLIKILSEQTADGFVFRVDLRLRPYGQSGPLLSSFDALLRYYQSQGRAWERYALIKARPLGGNREERLQLMRLLQPFVYRKYVDFGAIESLREMKQLIMQQVALQDAKNNIKIGAGGIREIEFIAQAWQLIRGGRDKRLRSRGLITILNECIQQNILSQADGEKLIAAYYFLRKIEHHLQALNDEQTHDLPTDPLEQLRLAFSMHINSVEELDLLLQQLRAQVEAVFLDVVAVAQPTAAEPTLDLEKLRLDQADPQLQETIRQLGFAQPQQIMGYLSHLIEVANRKQMSAEAWQRLGRVLLPTLKIIAAHTTDSEIFKRIVTIYAQILNRSAYLSLLAERPLVLENLLAIVMQSPWLADLITRYPVLLDEICLRDRQSSLQSSILQQMLAAIDADDLEGRMNVLREFKQAQIFSIAKEALLSPEKSAQVAASLSKLASIILTAVVAEAWNWLSTRKKIDLPLEQSGFLVVAYGRMGSEELNYHSDLDLVFLYADINQSDAYIRVAQRIVHLLTTLTVCGDLYKVDSRLRPEGDAGLLASSLESYKKYQETKAWTWEHQALVRARPVLGDVALAQKFAELRSAILCKQRDVVVLKQQMLEMRTKMRAKRQQITADQFDVRHAAGGMIDLEFIAQFLVLAAAHNYPQLANYRAVVDIMQQAAAEHIPILQPTDYAHLAAIYQQYQLEEQRAAVAGQLNVPRTPEIQAAAAQVILLWKHLFALN